MKPKSTTNPLPEERGVTMALFAMVIVVIFGVLALSIDVTIFSASHAQHRQSAEFAVLRALEVYGRSRTSGKTPDVALDEARDAMKPLIASNFTRNAAEMFSADNPAIQGISIPGELAGRHGLLQPIRYYFASKPLCDLSARGTPPCPCDKACVVDDIENDNPDANALKFTYYTPSDTPFKAFLGRMLSIGTPPQLAFTAKAIATLVPRNGVFVVDLSPSMVEDTHPMSEVPSDYFSCLNLPPYNFQSGRYAYERAAAECSPVDNELDIYGPSHRTNFQECVHNALLTDPPGPGNKRAQFECFIVTVMSGGAPLTTAFEIHKSTAMGPVKPEPLSSALGGVNRVLDYFKTRQVPGDRLGVFAFDSELVRERILYDADYFTSTGAFRPASVGSDEYNDWLRISDPDLSLDDKIRPGDISDTRRRVDAMIFPRIRKTSGTVSTDLLGALQVGRTMLRNTPDFYQSQNFVVAFTDGLANCHPTLPGFCSSGARNAGTLAYYSAAMSSIQDLLSGPTNSYVADKIALHLFLVGAEVAPHEVAWKSTSGGCMSNDELRVAAPPVTAVDAGGITAAEYAGTPFYGPNALYDAVKKTGGLWAPIRRCLKSMGTCKNFESDLNTACDGVDATPADDGPHGSDYWAAGRRIIYDPKGRTSAQQVDDAIERILSKAPFILVEPTP